MKISINSVLREIWNMKWDWLILLSLGTVLFILSRLIHDQWKTGMAVGFVSACAVSFLATAVRRSRLVTS